MAMIKNPFNGQLNSNAIFSAIFNMIISQQVFADNVKGTYSSLVDSARVDGTLLGDTKLYYATDCLKSVGWDQSETTAGNLLKLSRPTAPKCQALTIDQFRQISLTVDNYLTKQAWADEGAFGQFNSVMLGWMRETKRIYDATLYNSYVGTVVPSSSEQKITEVKCGASPTGPAIAQKLADLFSEMRDVSRNYNSYKFLRSYDIADLKVVWNAKYVNQIKKIDLPVIFHNDGIMEKFDEYTLPSRYFGTVNTAAKAPDGTATRTLIEMDYTGKAGTAKHYFPGDLVDEGTATLKANESYQESDAIICKVIHKNSIPYMSAFEVGTSFFNPKSLTENHYLTFGYNTLDYLRNYPIIKVVAA